MKNKPNSIYLLNFIREILLSEQRQLAPYAKTIEKDAERLEDVNASIKLIEELIRGEKTV